MPPVKKPKRLKIVPKGTFFGKRKAKAKRKPKNYNKQLNNFQKGSRNMLQIRTLLPKELLVDIQYRTQLVFDTMGYSTASGAGATGTIIRINLNDPTHGTTGSSASNQLVDVVSIGGTYVDPVFTRTNSSQLTLANELDDYFTQYKKACVVASNSRVRVAVIPNQKELGQYFVNVPAQGAQGASYPYDENHMPYLSIADPDLNGDMYVWSIKQKGTGLLTSSPLPDFHKLRTGVPGMKMKNLRAYKNGTVSPGVLSSVSHSPSSTWSIRDWKDCMPQVGFRTSGAAPPVDVKKAFHYVGICNTSTPLVGNKPCRVKADIVINYKCRFIDRANDPAGGDDPLAQPVHGEEL